MPDKWNKRGCESCERCWRNRLKHGNPESKKWLAKHSEIKLETTGGREQSQFKQHWPRWLAKSGGNNVSSHAKWMRKLILQ